MRTLKPEVQTLLNTTLAAGTDGYYPAVITASGSGFISGGALPMDGFMDFSVDYSLISGSNETVRLIVQGSNDLTYGTGATGSTLNFSNPKDFTASGWENVTGAAAAVPIITALGGTLSGTLSFSGAGQDYRFIRVRVIASNNSGNPSGTCVITATRSGSRKA